MIPVRSRRARRVRPLHIVGAALALTAAILVVGAPAPWPEGRAAPATVGVGAGGDAFGPAAVTVAQGDTVTWQWQGGKHSVTSTSSSEPFDSGALTAGTFQHTFNKPGTFTYLCVWHPGMQGTVTVTPAPSAPAAAAAPAGAAPGATTAAAAGPGSTAATSPAAAGGAPRLSGVRLRGPRLVFSLNHPATVSAVARSRTRGTSVGRLEAKPGRGSLLLALERLPVGRYTVVVAARNAAGTAARVRVRVRVTRWLRDRALSARHAAAAAAQTAAAAQAAVPAVAPAGAVPAPPPALTPATPPVDAATATSPAPVTPPCDDVDHSGHGHGSGAAKCGEKDGGS